LPHRFSPESLGESYTDALERVLWTAILREILERIYGASAAGRRPSQEIGHRLIAAIRSSIKSRSTSQSLSDERRSLSISSVWANLS
jgi:hypothetical protein